MDGASQVSMDGLKRLFIALLAKRLIELDLSQIGGKKNGINSE